jgi:ribosomal-protein-alanine N-acetyltransferase
MERPREVTFGRAASHRGRGYTPDVTPAIETPRLRLVAMTPRFLELSLANERDEAARLIGADIPPDWPTSEELLRLRLRQLRRDPYLEAWLLRAIVWRDAPCMVGHIGFHGAPGAAHLDTYAPHAAELGYTTFPHARGRGIATEAARALMRWAYTEGVRNFVVSIRPDNVPSLAIAQNLGFRRVGQHIDEEDGLEYVFLCSDAAD